MSAASEKRQQFNPLVPSRQVSRLFDRVLGYDFFISYAHADAPGYAEQLDNQLRGLGFKVFLDKREYVAGENLNEATLKVFEKRHGREAVDRYRAELRQLEAAYRPVAPGDRYTYCVVPEHAGVLIKAVHELSAPYHG